MIDNIYQEMIVMYYVLLKKNTVQQSKVSLLMVDDCTIFLKQNQSEIQIQLDLSLCQMHLNYPKN